jgi:hypothetical protein
MMPKLNAAFKRWFGKSVVRYEDGSPTVVYHGTPSGRRFKVFDVKKAGATHETGLFGVDRGFYGRGFYFTMNRDVAELYIRGGKKGRVLSVFLRIERPVDLASDYLPRGFRKVIDSLRNSKGMGALSNKKFKDLEQWWYDGGVDGPSAFGKAHGRAEFLVSHQNVFELLGFDGVVANENEIVVFHPNQIKSVDNDGTWDADDPDIGSNPPVRVKFITETEDYTGRGDLGVTRMLSPDGDVMGMANWWYEGPRHGKVFSVSYTCIYKRYRNIDNAILLYRHLRKIAKKMGAVTICGEVTWKGALAAGVFALGVPDYVTDGIRVFSWREAYRRLPDRSPEEGDCGPINTGGYFTVCTDLTDFRSKRDA